ncbi:E3 ubiquitin-protein ligase COP1-like isoform X2 [Cornus florida]|uniref:E3 ubiquitin-protein ligase COP1-like isoform X2 n=1 Tax=Cornus florida TaxID=4283 RepID=UPI00289F5608|nr:E3 ubiquitin-protein ligase COP1-like isoform X2 [Cornus florida]
MGESSMGALVPAVKSEPTLSDAIGEQATPPIPLPPPPETAVVAPELDKDFLCPICMQIIKDAFLTACGHSFCYMCIATHLQSKNDCPCCGHYLTTNHLFPNFLLNKFLMKTSASQIAKNATPFEQLRQALHKDHKVSVKELDRLLSLLVNKKRKLEQEEAEVNTQILLDFLHCLRKQKLEELKEIQIDLQYIKEDINAVERHRVELCRARERYSVKLRMLVDNPFATKAWPSLIDKRSSGINSCVPSVQGQCRMDSGNPQIMKADAQVLESSQILQKNDAYSLSDSQHLTQSGVTLARKRQVHAQECYLQKRRHWVRQSHKQEERNTREGYHAGLEDFQSVLSTFTRYSRLRVIAELRHGDLFHPANIVSSIEFDRDDELFATAGVSRRIKIFEYSSVVNEPADVQCPIVEMSTRSKLSCLSWNRYKKNHIASSDYEGMVTVWDVSTRQSVMEYEEHEKRAWSVDFSRAEPSMLVSGSDDCKVKVWCTNQEASVLNIDMKANICSVKYNPGSSLYVAVGSADRHIHYYDLRNTSQPLHIFGGHRKAVSYVKFLSNNELASASTDSTLRLWDVKENLALRTFRGHANEKNFVGLTVNSEYIACGSETNEVFVYHKAISKPAARHRLSSSDTDVGDEDAAGIYFISAVCWKSDSPIMLTANSQGTIKVLALAA